MTGPGPDAPVTLPRELVLASAGSGKTFRISSRIIGLLEAGAEPERILASTFARKAAGEILGMSIKGFKVERVLIEPALDIQQELYLGVTIDRLRYQVAVAMVVAGTLIGTRLFPVLSDPRPLYGLAGILLLCNAAYLAVCMLALEDEEVAGRWTEFRATQRG